MRTVGWLSGGLGRSEIVGNEGKTVYICYLFDFYSNETPYTFYALLSLIISDCCIVIDVR